MNFFEDCVPMPATFRGTRISKPSNTYIIKGYLIVVQINWKETLRILIKIFSIGPHISSLLKIQGLEVLNSFIQTISFIQFVASNGGAYTTPRSKYPVAITKQIMTLHSL